MRAVKRHDSAFEIKSRINQYFFHSTSLGSHGYFNSRMVLSTGTVIAYFTSTLSNPRGGMWSRSSHASCSEPNSTPNPDAFAGDTAALMNGAISSSLVGTLDLEASM